MKMKMKEQIKKYTYIKKSMEKYLILDVKIENVKEEVNIIWNITIKWDKEYDEYDYVEENKILEKR